MSESIKIEFIAIDSLKAQKPLREPSRAGEGESKRPTALVLFAGAGLAFGAATRRLIGDEGEALIRKAAAIAKFRGKNATALDLIAPSGFSADRLIVVGAGPVQGKGEQSAEEKTGETPGRRKRGGDNAGAGPLTLADYANLGGFALGKLGRGADAVIVLDFPQTPEDPAAAAAELLFGLRLRDYQFDRYKTKKQEEPEDKAPAEISLAVEDIAAAHQAAEAREAVAEGVVIARSLVNEPANILYPEEFANRSLELSKLGVEVEVLDEAAMRQLGMGAILGVAQGSEHESRVVIMRWRGGKPDKDGQKSQVKSRVHPIAFVGKGVCFDTGGISIKPAAGMEDMKGDMAGAACVVGLMHALAARQAKVDVIGAIGLVENMPGPKAQRPGDIVTSMSGQTIEVINTDAEGRLVLSDVLWYVQDKFKPKFIIDLATLTGAILVALGQEHAGLFTNDHDLGTKLVAAGKATGEKLWLMPLGPAYDKMIDSKFADMKNTGGRHAGSITAAQFLQRFVNGTPWAHLDIAGTGMNSPSNEINQSWGSGFGVRLLDRLVADHFET